MPAYDYRCNRCGVTVTNFVEYEQREQSHYCDCGGSREYQFPLSAALGFKPFEPFFCEPFDCDVNGKREWEQIKKMEGVQEKGKVHGAMLQETSQHAERIGPKAPIGRSYADVQRRRDHDRALKPEVEKMMDLKATGG